MDDNAPRLRSGDLLELITQIVESMPHMVFVKDAADLRFVLFNRAGENLLGYSRDDWERLRDDLLYLAEIGEATPAQSGPFGVKYDVRGILNGPLERSREVVSVWIVLEGDDIPRLVTAYPE